MKKILLPIIALITVFGSAKAQTDYCKDIEKTATEENVIYKSPTLASQFAFYKVIDEKSALVLFKIIMSDEKDDLTTSDAQVTFEDDSFIAVRGLKLTRSKEKDAINNYEYSVLLPVSAENMVKFKTQKVKSYILLEKKRFPSFMGNIKVKVMAYANCLDALNDAPKPVVNANEKKSIDGFWGIKFGASPAEVKTALTAKGAKFSAGDSKPDALIFDDATFTGRATSSIYIYTINDKFYQANVGFPELDDVTLIPTFNKIASELSDVYGIPRINKVFKEPYKEGDGFEASAIKNGMASYSAVWKTNNGNTISLQINKDATINIFYTDRTLEKLKSAQKSADY